jgi:hypothetical protein
VQRPLVEVFLAAAVVRRAFCHTGGARRYRRPLWGAGVVADRWSVCRGRLDRRGPWHQRSTHGGRRRRRTRVLFTWAHRSDGIDELRNIRRGRKVDLKPAVRLGVHPFVSVATTCQVKSIM